MTELFNNIRPYTEQETMVAINKLFTNPKFLQQLSFLEKHLDVNQLVAEVLKCKTRHEFHLVFANTIFNSIVGKTYTKIHYSGLENINPKNPYLFIGNHRDIILDSVFLQVYFFRNGYEATLSAGGDNLISSPLLVELARIHQMFLVVRSGTRDEIINNTRLLSSFISHSLFKEKKSVWISQKNGRTKNGNDKTQSGLLKMLSLSSPKNELQALKQMQITPIAISYQYEPCAKLKARELALSEKGNYVKQSGEDATSINEGIMGYKGEVHLVIGKPLQQEFDNLPHEKTLNEKIAQLCEHIDQQIYENYFLFPQNYIAFDIQANSNRFSAYYTVAEKNAFLNYLQEQSLVSDVTKDKMLKFLLDIYANPIKNKFKITNG